jgi:hypothetical protein
LRGKNSRPALAFPPPPQATGRKTRLAHGRKILVDAHSQTLFIFRPLSFILILDLLYIVQNQL